MEKSQSPERCALISRLQSRLPLLLRLRLRVPSVVLGGFDRPSSFGSGGGGGGGGDFGRSRPEVCVPTGLFSLVTFELVALSQDQGPSAADESGSWRREGAQRGPEGGGFNRKSSYVL